MENEVKQRNQRNRRRERAQRMQAQRESKVKDGDSGEDESPAREKPPRPPARRKKSKEPLGEEDIIDGFAIMAFRTYEDLEAAVKCASSPRTNALSTKPRLPLAALAGDAPRNHPPNNVNSHQCAVVIVIVNAIIQSIISNNRYITACFLTGRAQRNVNASGDLTRLNAAGLNLYAIGVPLPGLAFSPNA
ncbi:hypothetical protein RR46_04522 [Papilio xuthus]|uniref:Fibrosin-1-like protein n=1 Tax=Papilio xuthus TaxID=66420 RepID=A0A194PNY1_PAPXU|nr:hypothetical protein RR46_04522 [Papilio xuthus]